MNILFVTPFYKPQTGGVVTYIEDIRRALSGKGHYTYVLRAGESDKCVLCPNSNDAGVFEFNMRVPWIPSVPLKGLAAFLAYFVPTLWKLSRFLREQHIDLVSLEYPMPYMLYFYIVRIWARTPIMVGLHGSDLLLLHRNDAVTQWVVKHIIARSDWVLTHSHSLWNEVKTRIPGIERKSSCLHLGVHCARLRQLAEHTTVIDADQSPFILTVAKLYPRKGLDVLLIAIERLKQLNLKCRFLIAGDGPEEYHLKKMAKEMEIESLVQFMGSIDAEVIPRLFKRCEFFVLPSRVEPFGIVLLEAMTFGKAIVATTVGGIPEFVEDGKNGLLVSPEDSRALAEKIEFLIRDKSRRDMIGQEGRTFVEKHYDYERLADEYDRLFTAVAVAGS